MRPTKQDEALLDAVGTAFSRLRRRTIRVPTDQPSGRRDLSRNIVLNVVGDTIGEVTVGGIAEQLGVDPSVGSRMVSDCITAGLLVRRASQRDGRRTVLELTDAGASLREQFRRQQRQAFEQITRDWPVRERVELARLIVKYAEAAERYETTDGPSGSPRGVGAE